MPANAKLGIYDKETRRLVRTIEVLPPTADAPLLSRLAEPVTLAQDEMAFLWIPGEPSLVPFDPGLAANSVGKARG